MDKIEGIDLEEVLGQASKEMLEDKRRTVLGYVKNKLQTRDAFQADVADLERELATAKSRLAGIEAEIAKIASEDWSVISLAQKKQKGQNKPSDDE